MVQCPIGMQFIRRIIAIIFFIGLAAAAWFVLALVRPAGADDTTRLFTIVPGQGVNEISRNLSEAGLVRSPLAFETYLWLRNLEGRLIAGEYELRPSLSAVALTNLLTSGAALSRERTITTLEGWSRREIAAYLEDAMNIRAADFLTASEGQEGYLFPDTYRVYKDATAADIVRIMRATFDVKVTDDLRASATQQKRTLAEVITLASILEKEVRSFEEQRMAADLFLRRLKIGMPLQADSTVNFVTGKKTPGISFADRDMDSPYNTYQHRGLPPGPIGNPGLQVIRAALDPLPNQFWYFLTTEDDGRAIFSKTLEEHNRNKAKYLN